LAISSTNVEAFKLRILLRVRDVVAFTPWNAKTSVLEGGITDGGTVDDDDDAVVDVDDDGGGLTKSIMVRAAPRVDNDGDGVDR
jgi:hypothetical protein